MRTVVVDGVEMVYANSCPYCDGNLEKRDKRRICMECKVLWCGDGTVCYDKDSEMVEVPAGCFYARMEREG